MSIETLLEAARFLEWQAQQQKTREENEKREKLLLEREPDRRKTESERPNNVFYVEEVKPELRAVPAPPPPPPPPPAPAMVVVSHMVAPHLAPAPLLPQIGPCRHQTVPSPSNSTKEIPHCPTVLQRSPVSTLVVPKTGQAPLSSSSQHFPTSVLTIPSQHVIQQQPTQSQQTGSFKPSPTDDGKSQDQKRRPGGAGTREVHNKLEKNRRAHLKECFETLKKNIPNLDDKKTSNLSVLRSALRYIQTLKRKEKEYEHEMERLAREKIATQQRLADLKNEMSQWMDILEVDRILRQTVQPEDDQASTSTASEGEDNIEDDMEDMRPMNSLAKAPHRSHQDVLKAVSCAIAHQPPPRLSIQQKPPPSQGPTHIQPHALVPPQTAVPSQTHLVTAAPMQPTVIAHAAPASHASVIHTAVNHVIQASQAKHVAHIAPSTSCSAQPISHITVHPATLSHMAHLGQSLPAIYQQPMTVSQPVVSHLAHSIAHHQQVNGTSPAINPQAVLTKQALGPQLVHQQIVGSTVLNPVTMVTVPSFPVGTLKLT